jgi:uncharacterized membrane protein YesL
MFKSDGPLYKFMWLVADMFILGVIWLLFCLPIVTIGAATAAAVEVNIRILRKEETYIWKNFLRGFKRNFKDGTKLWILFVVVVFFLYMNLQYLLAAYDPSSIQMAVMILGVIALVLCYLYAVPLITKYENKTRYTLINSFVFALRYPGKAIWSLLQLGLIVFSYVFFTMLVVYYQNVPTIVDIVCMVLMLFGPELFLMTWAYRGMVIMDTYEKYVESTKADDDTTTTEEDSVGEGYQS